MSEPKFKVGDQVRCINPGNNTDLIYGKIYTISEIGVSYLTLEGYENHNFLIERFELVEQPLDKLEIGDVVICIDDSIIGAIPYLTKNKKYGVLEDSHKNSDGNFYVKILDDRTTGAVYRTSRFKLVPPISIRIYPGAAGWDENHLRNLENYIESVLGKYDTPQTIKKKIDDIFKTLRDKGMFVSYGIQKSLEDSQTFYISVLSDREWFPVLRLVYEVN